MFERIVLNLLANALKFTPRGTIASRLSVSDGGLRVSVTDTGIGIAEKDLALVFDRFRQLERHDERRSREGAGIGLSLVQQLVGLLGGQRHVRSTEEGSTFTVSLPWGRRRRDWATRPSIDPRLGESFISRGEQVGTALGRRTSPRARVETPPRRRQAPTSRRRSGEPLGGTLRPKPRCCSSRTTPTCATTSRATSRSRLRRRVRVVTVVEALEHLRDDPPVDIVLADVMMPRMDGLTLVREIRADARLRDVPVVLLSARAGVEASTTGLLEGADDYVDQAVPAARAAGAARVPTWCGPARGRATPRGSAPSSASIQEPFVVADRDGPRRRDQRASSPVPTAGRWPTAP